MTEIEIEIFKLKLIGMAFTIGYETDMLDGNAYSDILYLEFDSGGELYISELSGMHYITERECEEHFDICFEDAIKILKDFRCI